MNLGLGQFGEACHQMRQSIAIAEEIIREFPLSRTLDHETRGSTFRPTLIRSMLIIRGNALIRVSSFYFVRLTLVTSIN